MLTRMISWSSLKGHTKAARSSCLKPTEGFRFMDFPPEIRTMVYSFMLQDDEPIRMTTTKRLHEPRRPSRARSARYSAQVVFQISKQIMREAAPILYGNNHFQFRNLSEMKIFLDRIGSMRQYLRQIELGSNGFNHTKVRPVFNALKDATDLRMFTIDHSNVCMHYYRRYLQGTDLQGFAYSCRALLLVLHRAHKSSGKDFNVLDIVKIADQGEKCHKCNPLSPNFTKDENDCTKSLNGIYYSVHCKTRCKDLGTHSEEIQKKLRSLIAKQLGIKE